MFSNFKMIKGVVVVMLVAFSVSSFVYAADTATVTVQNISVTVADGTVSYGTLAVNATQDTASGGLDDSQTATNNGNIAEDFNIKGQNSSAWTLSGTQGSDQYFHKFCTSSCDASPTWTALTTNYQTLASNISTSGTSVFDLQIGTPTSSSSYTSQSVDVLVQAVAN